MATSLLQAWKRGTGPGSSVTLPLWQPLRGHPGTLAITHIPIEPLGGIVLSRAIRPFISQTQFKCKYVGTLGGKMASQGLGDGSSYHLPQRGTVLPGPQLSPALHLWKCELLARAVGCVPDTGGAQPHSRTFLEDLTSDRLITVPGVLRFILINSFYVHVVPKSQKPPSLLCTSLSLPKHNSHCC